MQYKAALEQNPISIAIAANNKYIHSFKSGIIDAADCADEILVDDEYLNGVNHAVLAVGYGHDEATGFDYLLVKNSWNTTWGENGYFKLKLYVETKYSDIGTCGMYDYSGIMPVLN